MTRLTIAVMGVLWFVAENQHFGWNRSPQSDAELLADGIFALFCALFALAWSLDKQSVTVITVQVSEGDSQ